MPVPYDHYIASPWPQGRGFLLEVSRRDADDLFMQGWPWKKQKQPGAADWRDRRAQRYGGETVKCALGETADISSTGMRVLCDGKPPVKPGGVLPVRLRFSDGSLQVATQVRWCRRRGIKRYEIGLQFIRVEPATAKVLEAIACFGMASAARHMEDDRTGGRAGAGQKRGGKPVRAEVDLPNYYHALELSPEASSAEIKASYRRLAAKYHPDRNDSPEAIVRFKAINEAYHVLCDSKRRETYMRMAG